ncbi:MAG: universal stress protein, partial [Thermodesulfobacteriota bacterium]
MDPKILIPVDDSPTAQATIEKVIEQHKRFPRSLTLLYVINEEQLAYRMIPDFQVEMVRENAAKAGMALLEKIQEQLAEAGFTCDLILETGEPRLVITSITNSQDFNLLV